MAFRMLAMHLIAASCSATVVAPAPNSTTTVLVAAAAKDLQLRGGAEIAANPLTNLRSGSPSQNSTAAFVMPLAAGAVVTSVSFECVGSHPEPLHRFPPRSPLTRTHT